MSAEWVDIGGGRKRLVKPKEDDGPQRSPNASPLYSPPEIFVKGSVAHIARTLPRSTRPDGSPAVRGADGYTKEGFPIIESQQTIDRVKSMNPELHLQHGDSTDATIERMLKEVPE